MLSRKRQFALAFLSAPTIAIVLALGCSSHNNPAPLSTNANLAALTVSTGNGDVVPAFAPATTTYSLVPNFAANPAPITVTATLADTNSTMTLNGSALASGVSSAPIPMAVGTNTLTIVVKAQDQSTTKSYTITRKIYAQNTTVHVLDSSNGTAVPNATITVADATGKVLQTGISVDATGSATLGLDGASAYNLSAMAPGSAQSLFAKFDSSRETVANFFCHPLGMINFPAQAPKFTALSYGPGDGTWIPVGAGNAISDTAANIGAFMATAQGTSAVAPTAWSGFGMGLSLDQPAWSWSANMYTPYAIDELAVPVAGSSPALYQSTMEMWTPFNVTTPTTAHYLDLVAFDVANNRIEQKIYVNVTDAASNTSQPDISALTPSPVTLNLYTHGLSRNLFAITPVDTNAVTYEPDIWFSLKNLNNSAASILGYDILRSTDGTHWTKIASNLMYSLVSVASPMVYTDNDPTLKLGVTYYYKVRCFTGNTTNNGGYTLDSAPVGAAFLPPFTASLKAPASESISLSLTPQFSFSISNPALFDPAVSDYFYFYLYVKEKTMSAATYGKSYRYNFALRRFEGLSGSTWSDASATVSVDSTHTSITIASPVGYFQPGVSYEWSIFGDSTAYPARFKKYVYPYNDPTSVNYAVALSHGSTYEHSYGAVNGYFTLTIDPNAK